MTDVVAVDAAEEPPEPEVEPEVVVGDGVASARRG